MLTITNRDYLYPEQRDKTTVFGLDELRSLILPLVERRGMRNARLFGSYARGEATGLSDIDLLVDRGDNRLLALGLLAQDIYESTGKLADVYDYSELIDG